MLDGPVREPERPRRHEYDCRIRTAANSLTIAAMTFEHLNFAAVSSAFVPNIAALTAAGER